jgi:hypothetical protein
MDRQNLFSDVWDGENEEVRTRHRRAQRARILAISAGSVPDVVAYPEHG